MLDEQLDRAVVAGFLLDLEGPLAGVVALELDARLDDQQGGGGQGDGPTPARNSAGWRRAVGWS
jgi:hypothetical protein